MTTTRSQLLRNARRILKDIGEQNAWTASVSSIERDCIYYLRACNRGYESRLAKDEIETLQSVVYQFHDRQARNQTKAATA